MIEETIHINILLVYIFMISLYTIFAYTFPQKKSHENILLINILMRLDLLGDSLIRFFVLNILIQITYKI